MSHRPVEPDPELSLAEWVEIPNMWAQGFDTMQIAEKLAPRLGRTSKAAEPLVVRILLTNQAARSRLRRAQ